MATAAGGSVANLGSPGLLHLLSFFALLAGEASPTRKLHSVKRTLRISPAASAAVSSRSRCPSVLQPWKSAFFFVPTTEIPALREP